MQAPLVSVLMTAYNRSKFIGEAIESVLASQFKDFELIIVDDCSTDNTAAIARWYETQSEKIKVFVNEVNLGQFKNRNKAASLATGTFIKYFDSDDVMNPDLLEITMEAMARFPQASVGIECTWSKIASNELPVVFTPREAFINHYFKGNDFLLFGPSSSVFKRQLFMDCNGYSEEVGILADTLLMLQFAAKSPVVGYQPNLFFWRRHEGQVTVEQDNYYLMFCLRHRINTLVLNGDIPLTAEEVKIIKQNFKSIYIRNILKYIASIKNPIKLVRMFKIMSLKPRDFFMALSKNKTVEY